MKKSLALAVALVASFCFAAPPPRGSASITPPENLVLNNIPNLPVSIAETAGRYADYRTALPTDWHPTRRELLISTRFGNTPQLHSVAMPSGERRQLTFFTEPVRVGKYHPNGGDYIVFSKDIGGGEWYQLFRYDVGTGESTLLTDGRSRNELGPWSTRGDEIAYTSTRRTGKDTDLWVINPANPKTDHLVAQFSGGGWSPQDWSADDKKILVVEYLSINESYLWIVDAGTGEKTALTPRDHSEQVSYDNPRFSKDGKGIYVTTDQGSEFHHLVYLDLATKQTRVLTQNIPWDVDEFEISWDGKKIAFVTDEEGLGKLHLLDTATGHELPVPEVPSGIIRDLTWHRNNRDLAFAVSSARSPYDSYSLDVRSWQSRSLDA